MKKQKQKKQVRVTQPKPVATKSLFTLVNLWRLIVTLITIITTIYGLYSFIPEQLYPELKIQSGQIEQPFSAQFIIQNNGILLAFTDVTYTCPTSPSFISMEGNITVPFTGQAGLQDIAILGKIKHKDQVNFTCPFSRFLQGSPIKFAVLHFSVKYKILGFEFGPQTSPTFTWNKNSKQWVEGAPLN